MVWRREAGHQSGYRCVVWRVVAATAKILDHPSSKRWWTMVVQLYTAGIYLQQYLQRSSSSTVLVRVHTLKTSLAEWPLTRNVHPVTCWSTVLACCQWPLPGLPPDCPDPVCCQQVSVNMFYVIDSASMCRCLWSGPQQCFGPVPNTNFINSRWRPALWNSWQGVCGRSGVHVRYRDMKRHDISIRSLGYDMNTSSYIYTMVWDEIYLYENPCHVLTF